MGCKQCVLDFRNNHKKKGGVVIKKHTFSTRIGERGWPFRAIPWKRKKPVPETLPKRKKNSRMRTMDSEPFKSSIPGEGRLTMVELRYTGGKECRGWSESTSKFVDGEGGVDHQAKKDTGMGLIEPERGSHVKKDCREASEI